MDLIPVLDLLDGKVVHGKEGDRDNYKPVESIFAENAEPVTITKAFKDKLGLDKFYIADLNSIQGDGDNYSVLKEIADVGDISIIADLGWSSKDDVDGSVLEAVDDIIIGTENLVSMEFINYILERAGKENVIVSIDMENGELLTGIRGLEGPEEAVERMVNAGVRKVILLDLRRVGSEKGVNTRVETIIERFPDLEMITGGGIRDAEDAIKLFEKGFEGLLIATAFHKGAISREDVERIEDGF